MSYSFDKYIQYKYFNISNININSLKPFFCYLLTWTHFNHLVSLEWKWKVAQNFLFNLVTTGHFTDRNWISKTVYCSNYSKCLEMELLKNVTGRFKNLHRMGNIYIFFVSIRWETFSKITFWCFHAKAATKSCSPKKLLCTCV